METDIKNLTRDFRKFQLQWERFYNDFNIMKRELQELRRELGVREGRELYLQMDGIEKKIEKRDDKLNHISRDVTSIRKQQGYYEQNFKEIMKALSIIYRNTDELEDELISERETN